MPIKKSAVAVTAVVIASITSGVLYFQPQTLDFIMAREPYSKVTIEGLKETYRVDEPITFTVKVEGYGCDGGFPTVIIMKNETRMDRSVYTQHGIWQRWGEERIFIPEFECPLTHYNYVRYVGDVNDKLYSHGGLPIIINSEGDYAVEITGVSVKGGPVFREFNVSSAKTPGYSINSIVFVGSSFSFSQGIAIDEQTHVVYISNYEESSVVRVNGTSHAIIGSIPIPYPTRQIIVNPVTESMYLGYGRYYVAAVDLKNDIISKNMTIGNVWTEFALDKDHQKLYSLNGPGIIVVNASNNEVLSSNVVRNNVGPSHSMVANNPYTNMIYFTSLGSNVVLVIDGTSLEVIRNFTVTYPDKPQDTPNLVTSDAISSIAVNPVTNKIYVSNPRYSGHPYLEMEGRSLEGKISVINAENFERIKYISTGIGPSNLVIDEKRNKIYLSEQGSVVVIDGNTDEIVDRIPINPVPSFLTVDTDAGSVFGLNTERNTLYTIRNDNLEGNLKFSTISMPYYGSYHGVIGKSETVLVQALDMYSNRSAIKLTVNGGGMLDLTLQKNLMDEITTISANTTKIEFQELSADKFSHTIRLVIPEGVKTIEIIGTP